MGINQNIEDQKTEYRSQKIEYRRKHEIKNKKTVKTLVKIENSR